MPLSHLSSFPEARQFVLAELIKHSDLLDPVTRIEIKNYFLKQKVSGFCEFLAIQSKYQRFSSSDLGKLIHLLPMDFTSAAVGKSILGNNVELIRMLGQANPSLLTRHRGSQGGTQFCVEQFKSGNRENIA